MDITEKLKNSEFLKTAQPVASPGISDTITYIDFTDDRISDDISIPATNTNRITYTKTIKKQSTIVQEDDLISSRDMTGIDQTLLALDILLNEHVLKSENELLDLYIELAQSNKHTLTKFQSFLRRIFKKLDFDTQYIENAEQLHQKILLNSYHIAASSRLGKGDFIVVSPYVLSVLQKSSDFVYTECNVITRGIIKQGILAGTGIVVYVKPDWNKWFNKAQEILIGRKTVYNSVGVYHAYTPEVAMHRIMNSDYQTNLMTEYKDTVVHTGNAEKCYSILKIKFDKKPLWRKLLKI